MSVVAVFAFNRAVAALGPNGAAAVIALVPVTVTVFAIPFLGDPVSSFFCHHHGYSCRRDACRGIRQIHQPKGRNRMIRL